MAPPASVPSSTDAPGSPSSAPGASPDDSGQDLRHSPLEDEHRALGAKLVGFGGWLMPLAYQHGTLAEHMACRTAAVAFDVSHLGTVRVQGDGAFDALQGALSNDLRKVGPGRAQYTHLLDEADGSVLDDIIVWWVGPDVFDVMPNASNTAGVRSAIAGEDTTDTRAVIAVQGPEARRRLAALSPEAAAVPHFAVRVVEWDGVPCTVAGTGYTGEDGVECAVPRAAAGAFWRALIGAGITPAGLGARDTLRLEAGFPLHGHELGPGITPLQAGLGWVVGWDKDSFRGKQALEAERAAGPRRRLQGLVTEGRQPPRAEAAVLRLGPGGSSGAPVGVVTSGNFSPVLGTGIALALLDRAALDDGEPGALAIDVRGRTVPVRRVPLPFVAPGSSAREGSAP